MPYCRVPQPRLVCAEYFDSQLVVEATLIQTRELHAKEDPETVLAYVYTLRVNQTLRGKLDRTINVYEGNDSGRATFDWVPGRVHFCSCSTLRMKKFGNSMVAATQALSAKLTWRFPKSPRSRRHAAAALLMA
jgi:hypothetical protein